MCIEEEFSQGYLESPKTATISGSMWKWVLVSHALAVQNTIYKLEYLS